VADLTALVRAAGDGDDDAFCELYTAVQPGLLRYLPVKCVERPGTCR
jgi:hypothetical protein